MSLIGFITTLFDEPEITLEPEGWINTTSLESTILALLAIKNTSLYPLDTVLSLPKILTFEILSCNVLPAPILITFCCVSLYLLLPKTIILGLTTTCSWVFQDTSSLYAS